MHCCIICPLTSRYSSVDENNTLETETPPTSQAAVDDDVRESVE